MKVAELPPDKCLHCPALLQLYSMHACTQYLEGIKAFASFLLMIYLSHVVSLFK